MKVSELVERVRVWRIVAGLALYGLVAGRHGREALTNALDDALAALRAREDGR